MVKRKIEGDKIKGHLSGKKISKNMNFSLTALNNGNNITIVI